MTLNRKIDFEERRKKWECQQLDKNIAEQLQNRTTDYNKNVVLI